MLNSYNQPNGFEAKVEKQQRKRGNVNDQNSELQDGKSIHKNVDPNKNNQLRQQVKQGKQSRSEFPA